MSRAGLAARQAALLAIADVEDDGRWSTVAVPDRVAGLPQARDRSLASHLAYDTIRWRGTLDWILTHVSNRPPEKIEPALLRILRLGALQLERTRIPARAVVDTSAELARRAVPGGRGSAAAGFVNGVLRGLVRRREAQGLPWPVGDTADAIGLRTAHPRWIVDDAIARFGSDAVAVLVADNEPPGLTLRANGDPAELVAELRALGIEAEGHPNVPEAVIAPGADPRRLDAVAEGRATPQDAASMLVAQALGARPGDDVLDLCAAPGGKTTHLARLVGRDGSVLAIDQHEHRAAMIEAAAERQALTNVTTLVGDAREVAPPGPFSRVLVDAPCTGLGVGRRRPEVRWRRTAQDAAALADLQADLLVAAALRVAPGGRLVYSVCTWTVAETTGVLERPVVRAALREFQSMQERQIRPDRDRADGMFVASYDRLA